MSKPWSNLAKIVYRRTYARNDTGVVENWPKTVERFVRANVERDSKHLLPYEAETLERLALERKAMPAGRGIWASGSPSHSRLGGAALNNCWFVTADTFRSFVVAQDMLMLGGGVGMSVEHRFVSKLPIVRAGGALRKDTNDADFIVSDTREGWCELFNRLYESFVTGKPFSYSTVCIRGAGEPIKGFGGLASGPLPLHDCVDKINAIFIRRLGNHLRPIDAADILCCLGEMVVAGNVRRSAIIVLGDPWDRDYLRAKRWDLGVLPSYRAMANYTVVASSTDDLHPLFWETYEQGEAFGLFNRANVRRYGRMGEERPDTALGTNPCGEASLEPYEPCNLQEIALPNLDSPEEFFLAARLMHRYGKRVTLEKYHNAETQAVIERNRRVGSGLTGCLASNLFKSGTLDAAYHCIDKENFEYSAQLGIPPSIRTTVIKPSGTLSKLMDCPWAAGIHGAYSRHYIQRVRFAANDPLVPMLRTAGHHIEPTIRLDGTLDWNTLVVDFYEEAPASVRCTDEGYDTWQQLDTLLMAQKYWSDQAVSVTVYYKKEDIPRLKEWLSANLGNLKSISFLAHSDHGFKQAPWEAISKEQYDALSSNVREIDDNIADGSLESLECESGACPIK